MTTRSELIEKAAVAMCPYTPACLNCKRRAAKALDALVPPGEAWIAPWEATDDMRRLLGLGLRVDPDTWDVLRDAHLALLETGEAAPIGKKGQEHGS